MEKKMATNSQVVISQPWYKQFWPWFLFGLPAVSVVVGLSLVVIARYWHVDSLVADEYYKDGKTIALLVGKFEAAKSLGLSAQATVREGAVSVELSAAGEKELPAVLRLGIIHPTQDRFDQHVLLQKGLDGMYLGTLKPLHASRWLFQLEDESRTWRMTGDAYIPTQTEVSIKPFQSGYTNQADSVRPSDS
jgi:hypothetical protein